MSRLGLLIAIIGALGWKLMLLFNVSPCQTENTEEH